MIVCRLVFALLVLVSSLRVAYAQENSVKPKIKFVYPIIKDYGGVVALPGAAEQLAKGTKVSCRVSVRCDWSAGPASDLRKVISPIDRF